MIERNAYYLGMEESGIDIEKDMGFPSVNTDNAKKPMRRSNGTVVLPNSVPAVVGIIYLISFIICDWNFIKTVVLASKILIVYIVPTVIISVVKSCRD